MIAMALMSRKKVESWWFWILPVNVSAIGLYAMAGAYMFTALYLLFLAMALIVLSFGVAESVHWIGGRNREDARDDE